MPPAEKAFSELSDRRQRHVVQEVSDIFQRYCPTNSDANLLLRRVFAKCASFLPTLSTVTDATSQLVGALGQLRASVSETFRVSRITSPCISIAQLDHAVCALDASREQLGNWGYTIGRRSFSAARREQTNTDNSSSRNPGGRPSKTSDLKLQDLVRNILNNYLQDSERIVVIGRGSKRKMILAKHLTQKRFVIYKSEPDIHNAMSRQTFTHMLKRYFPHVKPPRRLTDICFFVFNVCGTLRVVRTEFPQE